MRCIGISSLDSSVTGLFGDCKILQTMSAAFQGTDLPHACLDCLGFCGIETDFTLILLVVLGRVR